ncbi:hypothetical protein DER72_101362 [Halomonas sp. A11-A]|jgi:hypothetical protein|nr:hypothetical protein DER72_101362 [Halomonas sp. A11-A]
MPAEASRRLVAAAGHCLSGTAGRFSLANAPGTTTATTAATDENGRPRAPVP